MKSGHFAFDPQVDSGKTSRSRRKRRCRVVGDEIGQSLDENFRNLVGQELARLGYDLDGHRWSKVACRLYVVLIELPDFGGQQEVNGNSKLWHPFAQTVFCDHFLFPNHGQVPLVGQVLECWPKQWLDFGVCEGCPVDRILAVQA